MATLIGVGLYSVRGAARLIGTEPREIRRWLFGYRFKSGAGEFRASPPLWRTELSDEESEAIGFHDLLELRLVKEFVLRGVSLRVIRRAATRARELFSLPHPFTSLRFMTDGKSVFYEAAGEEGGQSLTDLLKRQRVFDEVVRPSLYEGIDFTQDDLARRWFPLRKSNEVVLDPDLSFGQPSLTRYGVPTDAIVSAVEAEEGDIQRVARIYELPVKSVRAALNFERRLARAA